MGKFEWGLFWRASKLKNRSAQVKFKRYLRAVAYTFNVHTLLLAAVACFAVYLCDLLEFKYNMDFTLVATGTTFPLVFTISQAFARRERATVLIANLKASVIALYFMHRDWDQTDAAYPYAIGNNHTAWATKVRIVLMDFLNHLRQYLTATGPFESIAEKRLTAKQNDELLELWTHSTVLTEQSKTFSRLFRKYEHQDPGWLHLNECYKTLSQLSILNEQLTVRAGYTRGGEGGLSRTNQYLRYIVSNLEELKMIRDYRTPVMMRTACGVLFHIFAVVLAPYFTHFCDSWISIGHDKDTCPAGYAAAIVYVMIVMLLWNVQNDIERPFDEGGLDDVFFTVAEELSEALDENTPLSAFGSEDIGPRGSSPLRQSMSQSTSHNHVLEAGGFGAPALGVISPFSAVSNSYRAPNAQTQLHRIPSGTPLASQENDSLLRGQASSAAVS